MGTTWIDGTYLRVFLAIYEEYRRIGNANAPLFREIDKRVVEIQEDKEFFKVFFYEKQPEALTRTVEILVRKRDYQVRDVMR
ncbi:MAG: hypothetical protein QXI60_09655 [Thermofilaceae archaeon]